MNTILKLTEGGKEGFYIDLGLLRPIVKQLNDIGVPVTLKDVIDFVLKKLKNT